MKFKVEVNFETGSSHQIEAVEFICDCHGRQTFLSTLYIHRVERWLSYILRPRLALRFPSQPAATMRKPIPSRSGLSARRFAIVQALRRAGSRSLDRECNAESPGKPGEFTETAAPRQSAILRASERASAPCYRAKPFGKYRARQPPGGIHQRKIFPIPFASFRNPGRRPARSESSANESYLEYEDCIPSFLTQISKRMISFNEEFKIPLQRREILEFFDGRRRCLVKHRGNIPRIWSKGRNYWEECPLNAIPRNRGISDKKKRKKETTRW